MKPLTDPDRVLAPGIPLTPFVLQRAHVLGHQPALIDGVSGRVMSYRQVAIATRLVAASLARLGLGRADVCAIVAPGVPECTVALLAVGLLGGCARLIDPTRPAEEMAAALGDARVIVTTSAPLHGVVPAACSVFILGEDDSAPDSASFSELYKSTGYVPDVPSDIEAEVLEISNTRYSHRRLVQLICQVEVTDPIALGEVVVSTLPFWSEYAQVAVLGLGLYRGATIVCLPRETEPAAVLSAVDRYGATRAYVEQPLAANATRFKSVEFRQHVFA